MPIYRLQWSVTLVTFKGYRKPSITIKLNSHREGRERGGVAVEEEGKEVERERESFFHHTEEVPHAREVSRERERWKKDKVEEERSRKREGERWRRAGKST